MRRIIYAVLVLVIVANVALAGNVAKGNPNPGIMPPGSTPHGHTYDEWGDIWWQWALSIPVDNNPLADMTGLNAAVGQSGHVWFLGGIFGQQGHVAERTVTVPPGKALFFPIVNYIWVNTPEFGDAPWSPEQEATVRAANAAWIDSYAAGELSCEIDGHPVADILSYRSVTPQGEAFMQTFPENNIWGIPADTYGPSVQDGIYLMLAPLSAGEHTIHFSAHHEFPPDKGGEFSLDVTYHLTVLNAVH
jgi:hypothetical protein